MSSTTDEPAQPPPLDDDAWWDTPRFSARDVCDLLIEYGERMPDNARRVVVDLWRRLNPAEGQ